MATIKIHAGDFGKGKGSIMFPSTLFSIPGAAQILSITQPLASGEFSWTGSGETVRVELAQIEVASEESVKRVGGAVGWGLAGAALLGPVGLLAGVLAGGRGKDVTFVATFKDGKRMLATTDNKTYTKLTALLFQ